MKALKDTLYHQNQSGLTSQQPALMVGFILVMKVTLRFFACTVITLVAPRTVQLVCKLEVADFQTLGASTTSTGTSESGFVMNTSKTCPIVSP